MSAPTVIRRSTLAPVPTWPDSFRRLYRERGYWTDETFASFVVDRIDRFNEKTAVVGWNARGVEVRWRYATLGREVEAMARRLSGAGVRAGDRVIVALPNIVEYIAVVLAIFRLGALPVFAQPMHRERELTQFCVMTDAAALVMCSGFDRVDRVALHAVVSQCVAAKGVAPPVLIDVARNVDVPEAAGVASPEIDPEDVAFLQLSGGTTGTPKLIPRTHADYLYSVRRSADICGLSSASIMLVVLPVAHNFTMSSPGILGILHVGATLVLARDPSPRTAFTLIERERCTLTSLVPPLAQAWIAAAQSHCPDLSSLKMMQVGGARLNDVIAREIFTVLGVRLQQVFGMAEGLVCYTRSDDSEALVIETQGKPMSADDEIRIVDEKGNDVPEGNEGKLLTRGPYTIRGYYRNDQANEESFTPEGFYRSGDLVRRLPSGHLIVTGRELDQINRGGEKIAAEEVEGAVLTHPDVLDAVALGVPDDDLGQRVCVVVRLKDGCGQPHDLAAHVRSRGIASYKIPDEFIFLNAFPETPIGKNSRHDLRRLLVSHLRSHA
jgi:2,3-dihydroxybenzoate-AMP ligase